MALEIQAAAVPLESDEHGVLRVGGTRVTLESVLNAYLEGESPDGIVERFPILHPSDVHATLAWYLRHRNEADAYLERSRHDLAAAREDAARRSPGGLTRSRFLARRST